MSFEGIGRIISQFTEGVSKGEAASRKAIKDTGALSHHTQASKYSNPKDGFVSREYIEAFSAANSTKPRLNNRTFSTNSINGQKALGVMFAEADDRLAA